MTDTPTIDARVGGGLTLAPDAQDQLFLTARTANTFADEAVTDDQIKAIYDLVKHAPTSMNMQPLRVVLVRSDEALERLLPHMSASNRGKTGAAPLVAVLAADIDFHDELHRTFPHFPGARDLYTADEAAREQAAIRNGFLQVGYLILGVRAAGLAAGPMTGIDAPGLEHEFFPDGRHRVLAVLNIGRPGDGAWRDRLPRLHYDEVVSSV